MNEGILKIFSLSTRDIDDIVDEFETLLMFICLFNFIGCMMQRLMLI